MNGSPLFGIAAAFIAGILIAQYTKIPFVIFWSASLAALAFSTICLKSNIRHLFFLVLSIIFLGAAVLRNSQSLPINHISYFTPQKGIGVRIEGIVDSDPVIKTRNNTKNTSFILNAKRLIKDGKEYKVCGRVLTKISGAEDFSYGDNLSVCGRLCKTPNFMISPRLNYRRHLESLGIYSVLRSGRGSLVEVLKRGAGNPLKALSLYAKRQIKEIIVAHLSDFSANILNAVILGDRNDLPEDLRDSMVQTGTIHIIAISGLHVGLVSFIILVVLKISRTPKKISYVATAAILVMYCLLTGARIPVVRVTIMAVVLLLGLIINRQVDICNSLSLAALLILIFNPKELFNISFQLSFISILSIVWLSPKIKEIFSIEDSYPSNVLTALFSGSLAAWLGLLPIIAYYFNIISPVAILANMIVVPYLTLIIGSAFTFILTGFLYAPIAGIFAQSCELSILLLFKFISALKRMPGAYFYLPDFHFSKVIASYALIFIAFLAWSFYAKKAKKSRKIS